MTFKIVLSLTTGLGQFRYPLHSCLRAYFGLFLWNSETFSSARFLTSCIMASLIKICLFLLSLSIPSLSLSSLFLKFCSPLPISDLPPLIPSSHLPSLLSQFSLEILFISPSQGDTCIFLLVFVLLSSFSGFLY